jgi:hypothetical protein
MSSFEIWHWSCLKTFCTLSLRPTFQACTQIEFHSFCYWTFSIFYNFVKFVIRHVSSLKLEINFRLKFYFFLIFLFQSIISLEMKWISLYLLIVNIWFKCSLLKNFLVDRPCFEFKLWCTCVFFVTLESWLG